MLQECSRPQNAFELTNTYGRYNVNLLPRHGWDIHYGVCDCLYVGVSVLTDFQNSFTCRLSSKFAIKR